jgi:hypothetical protein
MARTASVHLSVAVTLAGPAVSLAGATAGRSGGYAALAGAVPIAGIAALLAADGPAAALVDAVAAALADAAGPRVAARGAPVVGAGSVAAEPLAACCAAAARSGAVGSGVAAALLAGVAAVSLVACCVAVARFGAVGLRCGDGWTLWRCVCRCGPICGVRRGVASWVLGRTASRFACGVSRFRLAFAPPLLRLICGLKRFAPVPGIRPAKASRVRCTRLFERATPSRVRPAVWFGRTTASGRTRSAPRAASGRCGGA